MHVEGRDTGNGSTEKEDYIMKPLILYSREFTQEKTTINFLQLEPALLKSLCLLGMRNFNHKAQIPRKLCFLSFCVIELQLAVKQISQLCSPPLTKESFQIMFAKLCLRREQLLV